MNRTDIVKLTAKNAGVSQKTTKKVIDSLLEVASLALATGEQINLRAFGHLEPRAVKQVERGFHKPLVDNEYVQSVGFKPSSTLKRRMNRRRHG